MNEKYCKNTRCSAHNQGPCGAWDDCNMFMWDVDREAGMQGCGNRAVS